MKGMLVAVVLWSSVSALATAQPRGRKVVLFIGDGFGAAAMSLGIAYGRRVEGRELHLERLMKDGNTGYATPYSRDAIVIDSAAAASQIATGEEVLNETLGLSADGYPLLTILEWAELEGLATGLVSNMRLSHATPAAFASHRGSRYDPEPEVLDEMVSEREIEVLLGGGARALVPKGHRASDSLPGLAGELDELSNRGDERNRVEEARKRGYAVVADRQALARESRTARRLLGLFSATHLPYVLDRRQLGLDEVPSLPEMTGAALDVLGRSGGGFFLLIESGRIDYAGHDNDAGTMLHEILELDQALGLALEFQQQHPETLVLVTADHGTGGFSFTYGDPGPEEPTRLPSGIEVHTDHRYPSRRELELLHRQKASYLRILELSKGSADRLREVVRELTGIEMTFEEAQGAVLREPDGSAWTRDFRHFYGDQESNPACLLGRALARYTFVAWSTGGHTMEPVLTFGRGPGAEELRGLYSNAHIHDVMKAALMRPSAP